MYIGSFYVYSLSHFPGLKTSWSIANPPFVALPSITTRKSERAFTVTCPGNHSGRAVFKVVADMFQICKRHNITELNLKKRYLKILYRRGVIIVMAIFIVFASFYVLSINSQTCSVSGSKSCKPEKKVKRRYDIVIQRKKEHLIYQKLKHILSAMPFVKVGPIIRTLFDLKERKMLV